MSISCFFFSLVIIFVRLVVMCMILRLVGGFGRLLNFGRFIDMILVFCVSL